jgi:GT2 family glycosyltransferase
LLAEALASIEKTLRPIDQLLVVDSASVSPEVALTAERLGARVLRADQPGASIARNLGWRATDSPIVAFTDDDCRPAAGWLDALTAAFLDPAIGFVYGAVSPLGDGVPLSVTTATDPRVLTAGDVRAIDAFGHGANLAVRHLALQSVGGWEPRLGAGTKLRGGEDADLALRLLRAGWSGVFEPSARVAHATWRDRRRSLPAVWGYGVGAGAVAVRSHRVDRDWWLLRHEVGRRGVGQAWRDVRSGYQYGAVAGLIRTAGVLVGATRAAAGAA